MLFVFPHFSQKRRAGPSAAIEAAVAVTVAIVLREALPAVTDSQVRDWEGVKMQEEGTK